MKYTPDIIVAGAFAFMMISFGSLMLVVAVGMAISMWKSLKEKDPK